MALRRHPHLLSTGIALMLLSRVVAAGDGANKPSQTENNKTRELPPTHLASTLFDTTIQFAGGTTASADVAAPSLSATAAPAWNLVRPEALNLSTINASGGSVGLTGIGANGLADTLSSIGRVNTDVTQSVTDLSSGFSSLRGDAVVRSWRHNADSSLSSASTALPTLHLSSPAPVAGPSLSAIAVATPTSELVAQSAKSTGLARVAAGDAVAAATDSSSNNSSNTATVSNTFASGQDNSSDLDITFLGPGSVVSPAGPGRIGKFAYNGSVFMFGGTLIQLDVQSTPSGTINSDAFVVNDGILGVIALPAFPITISLNSLNQAGSPGPLSNFNFNQNYSWAFANAPAIIGFNQNSFTFDTSNFLNSTGNGMFFVAQNGNSLTINFTPVPEPSAYAMFGLGLLAVVGLELRRRKR